MNKVHYDLFGYRLPTCSYPECEQKHKARGLCVQHYNEAWRSGALPPNPRPRLDRRDPCTVVSCTRPVGQYGSYGMCSLHYVRTRRWGDPRQDLPPKVKNSDSYHAVHQRLASRRGPASLCPCQHCGGEANDWAYDHMDEHEQHGAGSGLPYSLDLDRYMPLCRGCHNAFDKAPSA